MSLLVVGIVLDSSREQRIDEGCLSQARFTSDLDNMRQQQVYLESY